MKREPKAEVLEEVLFDRRDAAIGAGLFLLTLIVYISTLAPNVYFGDSGELSAAAYNLGIAHPSGYPLYLLLGKLFMLLVPVGDAAMRMNLLSALFASLTIVMIYLIGRLLSHVRLVSILTSLTAAFSFTFWSQAVVAEVYTLAALFFFILIFLTLLWLKTRHQGWLLLLALTAGLALTHQIIIALFYPVFFIFILLNRPRLAGGWKAVTGIVSLFLLPLLLYLYLPIRSAADPLNDWGNPQTLSAMIDHITARQFSGMFLKHGLDGVIFQFNIFIDTLLKQFPFILLILAAAGIIVAWKRQRKTTLFLLALMIVGISYSTAYFITDIEPHFIHFFLILVFFMAVALDAVYSWLRNVGKAYILWPGVGILVILALLPLGFNRAECDRSGDYLARNYGLNIMASLDDKAVLFIDGEAELFVTAYLKIVEGLRPDVELYDIRQNIFFIPEMRSRGRGEVTIADLYKFALKMVRDRRPVYFTNPIFGNFRYAEYGVLYKVLPEKETPGSVGDPWEKYNLGGLDRANLEAGARETAGKYFFSRARYLFKKNQLESADDFYEKALLAAGDRHPLLKQMGVFFMQVRRYERAESLLKKAVKLNPFDPDGYNMLGMIAHYRLDYKSALVYYDKALALRGENISALLNRGMLYEQMGDKEANPGVKKRYYQKAYNDLEQSKKIEPSNPAIANSQKRVSFKLSRL